MNLLDRTAVDAIGPIAARPARGLRVLARLRAARLDAQLARGCSPDDGGQRAARAAWLVSPGTRRRLARHWEDVVERAADPHHPFDPRLPLPRRRVLAVAPDIHDLAARLRVAAPVPARGVALAHLLLTDGAGPLYRRGSAAVLQDAIGVACRHLDPETGLTA